MSDRVEHRRFRRLPILIGPKQNRADWRDGWRFPLPPRLIFFESLLALVVSAAPIALADQTAADAAARQSALGCEERFLLDRRDNPQNAIKNFHRCAAVQDISANMESLAFWRVTAQAASRSFDNAQFNRALANNAAILTGPFLNLTKQQAGEILDDSIVRGLKKGKREDLAKEWLANHNPAMLAAGPVPPAPDGAPPSAVKLVDTAVAPPPAAPVTQAVAAAPVPVEHAAPAHRTSRLGRHFRYAGTRNLHSDRDRRAEASASVARDDARFEPIDPRAYPAVVPASTTYYPQPQYPAVAEQAPITTPTPAAPYYAPPMRQPPVSPSATAAAPYYAPQTLQQPASPPVAAQPASLPPGLPQMPDLSAIPRQAEKNIKAISQLIDENIRTVQRAFLGPYAPR